MIDAKLVEDALQSIADSAPEKPNIGKVLGLQNQEVLDLAKEFESIMKENKLDMKYAGTKFSENVWKGFKMTLEYDSQSPTDVNHEAIDKIIEVVGEKDMNFVAVIIAMFSCVAQKYIVSKSSN